MERRAKRLIAAIGSGSKLPNLTFLGKWLACVITLRIKIEPIKIESMRRSLSIFYFF